MARAQMSKEENEKLEELITTKYKNADKKVEQDHGEPSEVTKVY